MTTTTETATTTTSAVPTTETETFKTAVEAATGSATDSAAVATTATASVTSAASTTIVPIAPVTSTPAAEAAIVAKTTAATTAAATPTPVALTTPGSDTQYVPVTHFLPELQVKDKLETENNGSSSTPSGVDFMLKDGISAVANMLQNAQKPAVLDTEYQEIGQRPYDKLQQSSTEQARKQATVKSDFDETSTVSENAITQELYEFTTTTESSTKSPEPNDAIAMESMSANSTEQIMRTSEPGLEMLTVFNVSSTGVPAQVAKLADLSAESQNLYDVTTPFENHVTTDLPSTTEEPITTTTYVAPAITGIPTTSGASTTAAITAAVIQNVTTVPIVNTVGTAAVPPNSNTATTPVSTTHPGGPKSPGPSSNAYRPLANSASPSTVELHPAPHESMGLEASVAFLGDDVRRFADLCNELSFKMWTAVTGKGQIASRSLVLSPFELTAMLAMVFLGARGPTSGQMNDVLRLDDMVTFNPHQVLRNITHSITNVNNPGVATASFVREIYSNKVSPNAFRREPKRIIP